MVAIRSLAALLTYVIGLCGMIPIFPWLTPFPRVVLVAGLISGLWQDRWRSWPLKPWMQNVLIVPVFFYYVLKFSSVNPVQPVISVLAIMLAVRLSGEKSVRHSLQIYVLSLFCLSASSLFDLSPIFLIYLVLLLFVVAVALVLLTFQHLDVTMVVSVAELKRILSFALLMPVLAVPLLLLIFPIMPRTQLPLWNFLNVPATRTTGYSDSVEPGSQSSIAESHTLAFRAEMPRLAPSQLYWRATVFNRTDGIRWIRSAQIPSERPENSGQTVRQIVYPEPSGVRTLVTLDRPVALGLQRVIRFSDGVFENTGAFGRRINYTVDSQVNGFVTSRNSINRPFYLQLPDRLPPRIKALAMKIAMSGDNDRTRVEFLKSFFRNGGYRYSTKDLATGDKALEQFLFDKKTGHCEFFASSFAVLLRAAGVPCRLVGGYLGGEYNQLGGYYLVTDNKAHVWVEAYIEGSGWERIDPSSLALNAGDVWTSPVSPSLGVRIGLAMDSLNYIWNRSVIPYDLEQQIKIARHLGSRLQEIDPLKYLLSTFLSIAGCLLFAGVVFVARKASFFRSREQRILHRFLQTVERQFAISSAKSDAGLFEIASSVNDSTVSDFVSIYASAVYHDRRLTDEEYLRLQQILRNMKSVKSQIP